MATETEDRGVGSEPESKGTISFSIRLTETQRDLLARAAEVRGWTVTNLLKNAALERAAHILNTTGPNRIDFRGIAKTVADQVFGPRGARVLDQQGLAVDADAFEKFDEVLDLQHYVYPVEIRPWSSPSSFFGDLGIAARFGGTEFLQLVLNAAESSANRNQPNLPEPIDPSTV